MMIVPLLALLALALIGASVHAAGGRSAQSSSLWETKHGS
jgi:hypothetical protein